MIPVSVSEFLTACGGTLLEGNAEGFITSATSDSRTVKNGSAFFAICGENADGHSYVNRTLADGAVCAVVEREVELAFDKNVILVDNTVRAMGVLARLCMEKLAIPTVAITGSVGKTTTRDMVHAVMQARFNTLKNEKNFNNELGVPFTVFQADETTEAAVIEMGMSHFGEIDRLSSIVVPDAAVVTNIGVSHIEHLGSQENIYRAKAELFANTKADGVVVLNGDDPILMAHKGEIKQKVITIGLKNQNADIVATDVVSDEKSVSFFVRCPGRAFSVKLPLPGEHNVLNALEAVAIGMHFGVEDEKIALALSNFTMTQMRMDIIKCERITIINDCYNAAPASVEAALSVLSKYKERKVAILGDIGELGSLSYEAHRGLGSSVVKNNIDALITIGEQARYIAESAFMNGMDSMHILSVDTVEEVYPLLASEIRDNHVVLVKASRFMGLERVTEFLKQNF